MCPSAFSNLHPEHGIIFFFSNEWDKVSQNQSEINLTGQLTDFFQSSDFTHCMALASSMTKHLPTADYYF